MSGLRAKIDDRRRALFQEWCRDPAILVSSPSATDLQSRSLGLHLLQGGNGGPVRAQSLATSQGQMGATILSVPGRLPETGMSLWVPAGLKSYRAAFVAFMKHVYGEPFDAADLNGYDVDHLLNKKRATGDDVLIRVEAVPLNVNRTWGTLFEKNASNPQFWANRKREVRSMSWMIAAKLIGKMPPRGPGDAAGIRDLAQFFGQHSDIGMSEAAITAALTDMLQFAQRFR